jgi:hypothetical protein
MNACRAEWRIAEAKPCCREQFPKQLPLSCKSCSSCQRQFLVFRWCNPTLGLSNPVKQLSNPETAVG